ncbi:hypothetical protein GCM10023085_07050 [Actinomadura viridis]|uniref:Uncharacterized protein n=1 Tax=Actinomadura viridis TaxID=58110 RepID=A0A931GT84_9ACTN|nr:hypothetical protein [Actinomadura viridis]MBG6091714.1 hypothetical protein [Actinomadura viridis]
MARVRVQDVVVIEFSWWERPFVLRRTMRLTGAEVDAAEYVDSPMRRRIGPRAGLWITGLLKIGLFGVTDRSVVSVRRGTPAVEIRLRPGSSKVGSVLISTPDAEALAPRIAALTVTAR